MLPEPWELQIEAVSGVGGFSIDFATGVNAWTRQARRILDVEDEDVAAACDGAAGPQHLLEGCLSAPMRERLHELHRVARTTGRGYALEIPIVTQRNRALWVRLAAEVEMRDGRPSRLVGAIQDITERRALEHRLRDAIAVADKASRSKSEFLANISHEIRTPLNALIGLGYLLQQTPLAEDQRQFVAKIQFAGRALLGVINNVLDLSKIEADEMSLEDEAFDLPDLVRDVSQMLLPQALDKGIELQVRCAASLPAMLLGDAGRVRQIVTNLLHNSIKFTERGSVQLKLFAAEQDAGRVRLRCEVSDTGIGIDPAACARLFTPFTQADASTTRRFGGTGLGLSIARRFVELMGGEIGVVSTPGQGSTFWFEIPLRIAPDVDGRLTPNPLRVLICDPRGEDAGGVSSMVRALGWTPQLVESHEQLLAALTAGAESARPDAVILDLHERDVAAHASIAALELACAPGEMPSVIVVAESPASYPDHKRLMRAVDVLLVRPVTSSALFNAINLAVSRRPDCEDRVFESTNFDELHPRWLAGVRVLVVDDSDINLEVARRIIEQQGAVVTTRSDGASALELLATHHGEIDIVLMDVQMPILDGNEATRRIRGDLQLGSLPIVALTAGALVGERQRSLDAGMNDFVSKPFDPQVLVRKVRRLVEQARGEPIPMVFDDQQRPAEGPGRLFMRAINAATVQQMFGDDLPLFKSLLSRLLRDYAEWPAEVVRGDLKERAHKLKGSAAMLGAGQVTRCAGTLERALQEERSDEVIAGLVKKLEGALATLREEARPLLEAPVPSPVSALGQAAPRHAAPADFVRLCELLESQNLEAVERFAELAPCLNRCLELHVFEHLQSAVDNLDFQQGAAVLRQAQPMLAAAAL